MYRGLIYPISFVCVISMTGSVSADLVAHWKLDEGSGTTTADATGNGHDGSLEGSPTWTQPGWDGVGWCLQFGGDSDRITIEPFDLTGGGITLAAWVYPTTFQDDARLISKSEGSGTSDHYWAMILSGNGENNLEFRIRTDTGATSRHSAPDTHDLATDEWTHIALTWDAEDPFMRFYKNGEEIFSQSKAGGAVGTNPDVKIAIGNQSASVADASGRIRPFGGLIDDVIVYDRALDKEELEAVMSGLKGIPHARKPDPADGSMLTSTWVNLTWVPGQWAVSHDMYFGDNFNDVNDGAEGTFVGNTANDFMVVGFPGFAYPDGLVPGTTYYWRIDEVNEAEQNSPWKGNVWSFMVPPKTAYNPIPADGAEYVVTDVTLSWTGGFGSKLHTVYFGNNFDDVNNATVGQAQGAATHTPGLLKMAKTYYWRVDEFDVVETYKGDVWSFTIEGAVAALDPVNGAVDVTQTPILTWAPGLGATHEVYFGTDAASLELKASGGSVVGYANPPFAEQIIVHSGNQSMPFEYNNAVGKSEATLTLTSNRDWTVNGVNKLTIWFRGSSSNAAEQMYIVLNGSAGVDNDNPNAAQASTWIQWNIDLQAFADQGVNLSNVTSITLGLRSVTGGTGMLYFDDIRLYPPAQ